jgi:GDPmannose 4,6-dehydratase
MWKMLNQDVPEDFVIATGITNSLQDFVEAVFLEAGLNWRNHVIIDRDLLRPSDPMTSVGNPAKAIEILGWKPTLIGMEIPQRMYREASEII